MSDLLYIVVRDGTSPYKGSEGQPYKVAEVVLGGEVVATGYAPNTGVYKTDEVAESSAKSRAQSDFVRSVLTKDVRRA
jgi:hypothetical protein